MKNYDTLTAEDVISLLEGRDEQVVRRFFVHIHKTGGHSLKWMMDNLRRHPCVIQEFRDHNWYNTRSYSKKSSVFSIIRNPFDWLVSVWEHGNSGQSGTRHAYKNDFKAFAYEFNSDMKMRMQYWNQQ